MGPTLGLIGLGGLVVGLLAAIRGHLDWARIRTRRAAALTVVVALGVLGVAVALTPPSPSGTTTAASTPSTEPSATSSSRAASTVTASPAEPSETPTTDTPAADPEANPTNTTPVNTTGWTVAPVIAGAKSVCRSGDPLANVYHPYRLQVVSACTTVSGTVETVRHEDDGDYHIDLALDPAYTGMLDAANTTYQHGWLVVEIVPADEPGCTAGQPPKPASGTYNYGICTGADETAPAVGAHVWVTGPYVVDLWHDWTEIHPAWAFSTTRPASGAPAPATTTSKAPAPATSTAAALTCSARMSNASPTDYSTTTVIVTTAAGATVTTAAHYKTTDTTHIGTADSAGTAQIPYKISRATVGYTVVVDVTATAGGHTANCSTSFTPIG